MLLLRMNYGHLWKKTFIAAYPMNSKPSKSWIALSLAQLSGLILTGRVGKHNDELAIELVTSTEGKTDCSEWHTDGWEGYERVLPDEVEHYITKGLTQRKRANQWNCSLLKQGVGIADKINLARYGSVPVVTVKLVLSYFNWIWQHSCLGTTAAQRAELTDRAWTWN